MNCTEKDFDKAADVTVTVTDIADNKFAFEPPAGKITIQEGPGKQISGIVQALRGLADALETLVEVEG
jgi:hypothetical protein